MLDLVIIIKGEICEHVFYESAISTGLYLWKEESNLNNKQYILQNMYIYLYIYIYVLLVILLCRFTYF